MSRKPFTFFDLQAECQIETACHQLDDRPIGVKIRVPPELYNRYPYNASAYVFLQQLRQPLLEFGTVEFPNLPLNKTNHTVAMRHPKQHSYSSNPFLTRFCQEPHQDTPPYPTAYWLDQPRRYSATWVMSLQGLLAYEKFRRQQPQADTETAHRHLVSHSLANGTGLLFNHSPGLMLMENDRHHKLYHARTCNFEAVENNPNNAEDTPTYAFNEPGLINYIDVLDSRRGNEDRDAVDLEEVKAFMAQE